LAVSAQSAEERQCDPATIASGIDYPLYSVEYNEYALKSLQ